MAELSPDEEAIIKKHSLSKSLDDLCSLLQEAEKMHESRFISYDVAVDSLDQLYRNATSKLVVTLQGEDAARHLRSRISDEYSSKDLPLPKLKMLKPGTPAGASASGKSSSTSSSPSREQPLRRASLDGTPVLSTSSSQKGDEQTRELVEPRIFEEIRGCTFQNIDGFFAKYFEERDWGESAEATCRRALEDNILAEFPEPPAQNDVLNWWCRFQDGFLSETRGVYFHAKTQKNLIGSDAKRQIDLLLKARDGNNSEELHDFRNIWAVGELKKPEQEINWTKTLLQIGCYVREIFTAQPTRRFIHAFALCGTKFKAWVFDRSGAYSSNVLNVHRDSEKFIRMITGYAMMSDEELGFDIFMTQNSSGSKTITVERAEAGGNVVLQLGQTLCIQRAIVCRGTTCFRATDGDKTDGVAKFSWVSKQRTPEVRYLELARQRGVKGVARVIGHCTITSIADMRRGLAFDNKRHSFRSAPPSATSSFSQAQSHNPLTRSFTDLRGLGISERSSTSRKRRSPDKGTRKSKRSRSISQLPRDDPEDELAFSIQSVHQPSLFDKNGGEFYDNRVLRCLVISPAGRPIYQYESPLELLKALRDAIKAHRSLYLDGNILHRDISENNIIITDPEKAEGNSGMLIDLDLAKEVGSRRSGARHQTGTMEFMAIEVLLAIDHTYRHDLESFFYVLIWQCARHGWKRSNRWKEKPKKCLLTEWYTGGYDQIANAKRGRMDVNGFEDVLLGFPPEFNCVKPLCRELREVLFPYCRGLFVGTPVKSEILYDPIIQAFHKAIENNFVVRFLD
ncbi:hypothetical protein EMCG_01915 [[Emmonsia] crescens]|uniref:non-specific serine/threonine protein kinase n=1 Tax=[Emmonsia] crescens TaxID=73230 RepID=A0A0G2J9D9_9EURO|nr:hypothetical protein EMCG_01915 [Emmonsia crescens UAMH 3008]